MDKLKWIGKINWEQTFFVCLFIFMFAVSMYHSKFDKHKDATIVTPQKPKSNDTTISNHSFDYNTKK